MPRTRIQRIQDSVHGMMEFDGMETVVIDVLRTPEIQRLRRIRQLGLAHFVFPGAEHSRLVHSLGASYLAIKFGRHLAETCKDFLIPEFRPSSSSIRDLAVAALCHDLGHGPLSHVWEREIVGNRYDFDAWLGKLGLSGEKERLENTKWHELVGHGFLAWEDGFLHKVLEQHEVGSSRRISNLLTGEYFIPYLPYLLSSDIDVDRADYLKRDTHQSGVAYGRYDLERLISTCSVGETSAKKLVIGFNKKKALRVIEQFLIARRALYETVYYHKTVRSIEGMVLLFLRRLKKVVKDPKYKKVADFLKPMIKIISGEVLEQSELLSLDDFSLWVLINHVVSIDGVDDTVRDLGLRILSRDLFKIVPCSSEKVNEFLINEHSHERLYDAIKPFCPGERQYYLYVDKLEFRMLYDTEEKMAFFIEEDHLATPIYQHESLKQYWQKPETSVRLFTIREAVDAVKKIIE